MTEFGVTQRVEGSDQKPDPLCPELNERGFRAHHWQIETAEGEYSSAKCKNCEAERSFSNFEPKYKQNTGGSQNDPSHTWRISSHRQQSAEIPEDVILS